VIPWLKARTLFLTAALLAQETVPAELLDNLDFFMEVQVDEVAADETLFEVALSTEAAAKPPVKDPKAPAKAKAPARKAAKTAPPPKKDKKP